MPNFKLRHCREAVADIQASGARSVRAIAAALSERNIPIASGRGRGMEGADMVTILGRQRVAEAAHEAQKDYLTRLVAELQACGVTSPRAIAAALNERLIPPPRGQGIWRPWTVRLLLARRRA